MVPIFASAYEEHSCIFHCCTEERILAIAASYAVMGKTVPVKMISSSQAFKGMEFILPTTSDLPTPLFPSLFLLLLEDK